MAISCGIAACGQGKKVRSYQMTELITHLMEAREDRDLLRLKRQLSKLDLLILDELGYVPASKLGSELLFDVISTAYERMSLIVTTNLPFDGAVCSTCESQLARSPLQRTTHRSDVGSLNPPLSYSGNRWRKLPITGCQTSSHKKLKRQVNQDEVRKGLTFPANPSHIRRNLPATSATLLARPALRFLTVVYRFTLWDFSESLMPHL